jgi:uncharacterized protein (TIGR04141 family)
MAASTSKRTLFRLKGVAPTVDAMFDALDGERLDAVHAELHIPPRLEAPAILLTASFKQPVASWCEEVNRTTGCDVSRPVDRSACLLMLAVDDEVYAIGYDQGFRLVPDHLKDQRFGLSFAIRRVDPDQVRDLVSHTPGLGRIDITLVPGGAPLWSLGLEEHAKIIRRLGGHLDGVELTISRDNPTRVSSAEGGAGLRIRLGVDAPDLIGDIRAIARVLRQERPRPEFEFVEHIVPIKERDLITRLEGVLDDMLGQEPTGLVTSAVPAEHWDDYLAARAFTIKINSSEESQPTDGFELSYVLDRARVQRSGGRVAALRNGRVTLYRSGQAERTDVIWSSSAFKWLEADVSLDARRFFLMDEHWYEISRAYLKMIRAHVERLITDTPSVDLPEWTLGDDERDYNQSVPRLRPGYVCLDRDNVQTSLHRGNGVEICDLLSPDNILVMVKRARGSSALSHLFSQGLVAVQTLGSSPESMDRFARKVAAARNGETLPANYRPSRVVFAILLKDGSPLTADTLFPFSQVTLVHTAKVLESWGVVVEVTGIRSTPASAPKRGGSHVRSAPLRVPDRPGKRANGGSWPGRRRDSRGPGRSVLGPHARERGRRRDLGD